MTFLQPTYLWALFSLAIPLVIHLLNRGDIRTIKVGSVKFLKEFDTKQSRKIKLNELLLLLLRMLLLGLVILSMAEPQWKINTPKAPISYFIEPALADEAGFMSFLDSLPQNNMKWFSQGFPEFGVEVNPQETVHYWQLAQKLHEVPSDSFVVFTKGLVKGIQGARPLLAQKVRWVVVENEHRIDETIAARNVGDSVQWYHVTSSSLLTDLKIETLANTDSRIVFMDGDSLGLMESGRTFKIPALKNDTLDVLIAYDEAHMREMHYFSASLKAIGQYGMQAIRQQKLESAVEFEEQESLDLLIWLRSDKVPSIKQPTIAMVEDSLASSLLEKTEFKNRYHLTRKLNIQNSLEGNLTNALASILLPNDTVSQKMNAWDGRVVPEAAMATNFSNEEIGQPRSKNMDISPYIWLSIVLVLVMERILAKLRKQ
ncbi:BatA domain-containing protein [Maribacter sp. 4G9]|uniref:BatA domain-containing protein n=1 Tax=Maribacter sp. 4G9 TaxID=1889777 RepID=UPI000C156D75|nr:BatA domain-containing protein [Maribacter sp. 4G9]PIB26268.1 hypothetical protein BFP75_08555 [Maribacter sp. 4G9]